MKRYLFRDVGRMLGSSEQRRYLIAVMRQLGGKYPRQCNLCGFKGMFRAVGHPPRYDAHCPGCRSRERHRLFGLMLDERPDLGAGQVIHFAPEASLAPLLKRRAARYQSADLSMSGCDLMLNIEALDLPDKGVDLFVLNHVLEHVADDRKGLAELYRCLAPRGTAAISVPLVDGWPETYEDPAISHGPSDTARQLHYGWPDHLRFYGRDLRQRIAAAGFELSEYAASGAQTALHGLVPGETIFLAHKPG